MHQKRPKQSLKTKLINKALHFLGYRQRSTHELENYLKTKTSKHEIIPAVIEHLSDLNLIDDQKFATWLAESRLKKHKGPIIISYELTHRFGVDRQLAKDTIANLDKSQITSSATAFAQKKLRSIKPGSARRYKLKNLLYQRGFDSATSTIVIDELDQTE